MERQVLDIIIALIVGLLFIAYYYRLYKGGKVAKILLIFEIGVRIFGIFYVINYGKFYSIWDLLYYIPALLSIALYYSRGFAAKIILGILNVYVVSSIIWTIYGLLLGY